MLTHSHAVMPQPGGPVSDAFHGIYSVVTISAKLISVESWCNHNAIHVDL